MKNSLYAITLVAGLGVAACGNAQNNQAPAAQEQEKGQVINKDVDVAAFEKLMAQGDGLLLDVRTDGEFASGHLKGATQIDFNSSDFKSKIAELDKDVPVYVYCRSGGRSGSAAHIMKGMGFKAVFNLEGGILAWERNGKPVEK